MRLARYSASDTYYPQTISILRLDRPQLTSVDDEISSTLRRLLPQSRRPDSAGSASDRLKALSERMKAAESTGDTAEQARLLAMILEIAQGKGQGAELAEAGLLSAISQDLEKAIKESLAFRGTVSIESAEAKAHREGETAELLTQEVGRLRASLGLSELLYVDDLPIITATYSYTRRDFEPIYDELGAQNLPVEIRAFPSVQKAAAQRLDKMDLVGTIPILAREGEHEGIFMSLLPDRVIDWLALNDITLPDAHLPPIARILAALEPIDRDRYYDSIWQLRIRRMVFGLIHSLSHAAMRAMTRYAGIDRTSVAEYIFFFRCWVVSSTTVRVALSWAVSQPSFGITWQPSCETLRTTRWNASTMPIVRTTREPATAACIPPKYLAAYSITAYLEHSCSAVMRRGQMFLRTCGSSAIGRCRAVRDESLRRYRQVASVATSPCRRCTQEFRRGRGSRCF
ncbi:MAG TPA: hypothetical protein VGG14_04100 [Candidatus Sulfotelmatobacter sp.]|jgi:hypothetical protein